MPAHPPVKERTDADLLSQVALGAQEALAELFQRYGGRVLAYVRAMAGPRFPAEDAVQEIFLTLWQKAGLYAPQGGEAAGWIFTITRHKVFDIQRSLGRVRETGSLDLELLSPGEDPVEPSLAPSLHKALSMLPPEQAQPIRLAYYGDLTYGETAKRLGIPLGTLKTRIRTGLAALRRLITP
jgi:RNA polymerase sigma-70 factor, ECF subfamily